MKYYRVDQVVNGKAYQGGRVFITRQAAEREAKDAQAADRTTGESQTTYKVTEVVL